jgi:1-acyl-sn-glycerol-3-phosphate acyltransferase
MDAKKLTLPIASSVGREAGAARLDTSQLVQHNQRIGTRPQRLAEWLFTVYVVGPLLWALVRLAFRVRVENAGVLDRLGGRAIFAIRHFHEWDAVVLFYGAAWTRALRRPYLHPNTLVGPFWSRGRWQRFISFFFGNIAVGRGPSGLRRAGELLGDRRPFTIGIAPTGPIGLATRYEIKPGVAALALAAPAVPVISISIAGVQGVRLGPSLFWRRPRVTIRLAEPFHVGELPAGDDEERAERLRERIRADWERLEGGR